jgi:uncharacterized protein (DUF305 family)
LIGEAEMKTKVTLAAIAAGILILVGFAYTQMEVVGSGGMAGMEHPAMASADASESTKACETAMTTMMTDMVTNYTGKPDVDFATGMIPHHQGAIAIAKVALQHGKDADIRKLAENVIKAQESEIALLKNWLAKSGQAALSPSAESAAAYKEAMSIMMKEMMTPYTGNADVDFARGMIPHHKGAVAMAKIEIQYGIDPEVRKIAEDAIRAQEGEIAFLNDWLAKNS